MKYNKKIHTTQNNNVTLEDVIISQNYADIIVPYLGDINIFLERYNAIYYQILNEIYAIIYIPLEQYYELLFTFAEFDINTIPTMFGPYSLDAIEDSGILDMHNHPFVPLRGRDVLIGLIDSGIDYRHPTFIYEDNTSKIVSIWDQTLTNGNSPMDFFYGSEYTNENINEALNSDDPLTIVPSVDETGHGTFLAGTAAGRYVAAEGFAGAAPDAEIIMVKLKRAKEYLLRDALIPEDNVVYQNTDIIQGLRYLVRKAMSLNKPLAICIGLGTNIGAHDGTSILEEFLTGVANYRTMAVVVASGNEADLGHHYEGNFPEGAIYQDVELNVAENEEGVIVQLWADTPDIYSIGIVSPMGEFLARFAPRIGQREEVELIIERSKVYVEYQLIEEKSGDEFIIVRIEDPTPGIWTIRVYGDVVVSYRYNMWIDREGWIRPATRFLSPSANTTVTIPSTSKVPITVGAYNHLDNSLFIGSGRGPTRDRRIKPELVAPGVNIIGPLPNNQYGIRTGTSIAAAQTAGASALLLEWSIVLGNEVNANTRTIKKTLMRGATRRGDITYPNNEWGYGALNVLNAFQILRGQL
ncbi:subtilase family protein [Natranaerovirga hydrolytica]|uniref:Subtilase family protein n=1 Tax=Natranaerovirga hydrolytica TaxID=680378 RepID=A0A4V2Q1P8_9FIRM|nr:S8 family peptidase [Natranaerovirga hydrolytica]TCK98461.1 subtilase family protein [Natranaerovirga hydrolytica]